LYIGNLKQRDERTVEITMFTVTESAGQQLKEFLGSEKARGSKLVIYFQGVG
jgi:hypothetical protein